MAQQYNKLTPELIAKISEAANGHVYTGDDVNADYARDEMPIYGEHMPEMAVLPRSTEEVAAVMKLCNENRIPVTARGAGTGLVGGAVPVMGGVLLDMTKMNEILSYDLDNLVVRVQPGVLLNDLAEDCSKQGLMYPPDPGEKFACLGGNVATNAGGMRAVKYGTTRDFVLAMTVVLPTGEVTRFGASVSKTSSGYSLLDLMIGSEGTLGVITELSLRLIPAPKCIVSMIVPFVDLETAISAVPKIKMANLDPQALEFMEKEALLSSERYIGKSTFPKEVGGTEIGAYLLITFDSDDEDRLNTIVEKACEIVLDSGAVDVLIADTAPKLKEAWAARSSLLDAIMEETKLLDECDVVVPVNKIPEFLEFANSTGEECGLTIKSFGHAGDGNLHIYQCSNDLEEDEFKRRVDKYFTILYKKATEVGGLVSGEHGIGQGKIKYLRESIGQGNLDLMFGIKKVFDPNLILNPGKVCYEIGSEPETGSAADNAAVQTAAAALDRASQEIASAQKALGVPASEAAASPAGTALPAAGKKPMSALARRAAEMKAKQAGGTAPEKKVSSLAETRARLQAGGEKSGLAAKKNALAAKHDEQKNADPSKSDKTEEKAEVKVTPVKADVPAKAAPAKAAAASDKPAGRALNILVCIKQVPDTTEIKIDPVKNTLIRDGVESILNPFDGYALEAAARLKDANPDVKIIAVSMGPQQATAVLKEALGICADKAYLVSGRKFGGSDTLATSYILSRAVKKIEELEGITFDAIFCGKQAIDGDTAQVGPEIAEHLGLPQVTYGLECSQKEDGSALSVTQEGDAGQNIIEVSFPCLVTFTKPSFDPRFPTLKRKLAANKAEIPVISDAEGELTGLDETRIGLNGSPTRVKKTFVPPRKQGGVKYEKQSDEDTPEVLVHKMFTALSENHIL